MDPLFTVPMYGTGQHTLCYEVRGIADHYFNLISDECVSVNALYVSATDNAGLKINVMGQVAIRAVDLTGVCVDILIDPRSFTVSSNGMQSTWLC